MQVVHSSRPYHAVPFSLHEYEAMNTLFKSAFGSELRPEVFRKRYDTSSLGAPLIGYIAFHTPTGQPAAYYGVFPVRIVWEGKVMLSAQSGDTMTHADYRKQGLFIWLARLTYESCLQQNIRIVFGMPNENSYHGFTQKLNWKEVDRIGQFDHKLRVKTLPLAKWCKSGVLRSLWLKWATKRIGRFLIQQPVSMPNSHSSAYAKQIRDSAYLEYKNSPEKFFIVIHDVVLWIKFTDVLWIGEIGDYDKMNEKVWKQLRRLAFILGYNTIRFHLNTGLPLPSFLNQCIKSSEEPLCFIDLDGRAEDFRILLTGADFDTW